MSVFKRLSDGMFFAPMPGRSTAFRCASFSTDFQTPGISRWVYPLMGVVHRVNDGFWGKSSEWIATGEVWTPSSPKDFEIMEEE